MNPNKRLKRDPSSMSPSPGPFSSSSPLGAAGGGTSASTSAAAAAARRKPSGAAAAAADDDYDFGEPDEDLERQRKEAIYRRLVHYRREGARQSTRAERLEDQRVKLEADVRAVEACWSELVVAVGSAVNARPDLLLAANNGDASSNAEQEVEAEAEALQNWAHEEDREVLTPSADQVEPTLRRHLPVTRDLVSRVVAAALSTSSSSSSSSSLDPTLKRLHEQIERYASRCAALRTTLATVRFENAQLRQRAEEAEQEREVAETKLDRVRMSSKGDRASGNGDVEEQHGVKRSREATESGPAHGVVVAAATANGDASHDSKSPIKVEGGAAQQQANQPNGHPAPAGDGSGGSKSGTAQRTTADSAADNDREVGSLRARLAAKQLELEAAVDDARQAREDAGYFRSVVHAPPEEYVARSPSLAVIKAALEEQMTIAREARARHERAVAEADNLRDGQEAFRENFVQTAREELEALRARLRAQELDVARLRGQRDGFREEVEVRKAEQASQYTQGAEMKALAEARAERLTIMRSEVTRLRSKMAATAGEEDYLTFLLRSTEGGEGEEVPYVRDLERRARELEVERDALQAQLAERAEGSIDAQSALEAETQARTQLADVQKKLAERDALFQGGSEAAQLAHQLEEKDKAIKRLELQVQEADASMNALYTEVDAMSRAYESMETIAVKKIYDLKAMEDSLMEARGARQKADHKYFAECRRIAGLAEQQVGINKVLELQRVALEKAKEVESQLHQQLSAQEKEMTLLKNTVVECQDKVESLKRQADAHKIESDALTTRFEESQKVMQENIRLAAEETKKRQRAEDELAECRFKMEQMEEVVKMSQVAKMSTKEVELQRERDMLFGILRCSLCRLRFKTKILRGCLHTFCEDCITDRVKSRQRKCPTCMDPFAESDIKPLF